MVAQVSVSTRISIRWPPAEAAEPTDTLVIIVDGYYVDLRISKADNSLDWALAGQKIVLSQEPVRAKFTNDVNSHAGSGDSSQPDIGEFTKLPNGDDLETGVMSAPHAGGKLMPYEEIWRDIEFDIPKGSAADDTATAWVVESVEAGDTSANTTKVFYARAGRYFLGVMQTIDRTTQGQKVDAIRKDFDVHRNEWITKYTLGNAEEFRDIIEAGLSVPTRLTGDVVSFIPKGRSYSIRAIA